ncbi:MAG: DMT family transporter [Dehalococcoidia bacterium]|nr:DMT family transporter [Dehalococcoidia bacterium]
MGAALSWAVGFLIIKPISTKFSAISINTIVLSAAWIVLVVIVIPLGKLSDLTFFGWRYLAYIIGSAVAGQGIGFLLEIKSMSLADISLVYPINVSLYFLSTSTMAAILFDEPITFYTILGAAFIITGITLLSVPSKVKEDETLKSDRAKGVILASIAGLFCGGATILGKLILQVLDPLMLNVVRLPFVILPLLTFSLARNGFSEYKRYTRKDLTQAGVSGVVNYAIGTVLFYLAMNHIGAAKASILSSISPLFIAPLSVVFLKEKLTKRVILGTIVCSLGISLTTL